MRTRGCHWNVKACCVIDCEDHEDLPSYCDGINQLEIEFRSEGSFTPQTYWEPADGEDYRTLIRVVGSDIEGKDVPLTREQQEELFERFWAAVNAEPLDDDDGDADWRE